MGLYLYGCFAILVEHWVGGSTILQVSKARDARTFWPVEIVAHVALPSLSYIFQVYITFYRCVSALCVGILSDCLAQREVLIGECIGSRSGMAWRSSHIEDSGQYALPLTSSSPDLPSIKSTQRWDVSHRDWWISCTLWPLASGVILLILDPTKWSIW